MKKQRAKLAACLMAALLGMQTVPVLAVEGETSISLSGTENGEDRTLDISCMLENGEGITNGKLRILYDANMITLEETAAGKALSGGLAEINDCLTGNKEEGEIVLAFASANNITPDGSLIDMGFELKDGVKKGDEISFEIRAENMGGDNGDVSVEILSDSYTVGDAGDNPGNGGGDTDNPDNGGNTEKPGNGTDNGNDSSKNNGKPDGNKKKAAKTGDNGNLALYASLCGVAAVAAGGAAVVRIQRKKR